MVLSIGFYGVKGGMFTLRGGGAQHVLGPSGSFIEGNTEIGLALVMMLPLMRYLHLTTEHRWIRRGLVVMMLLTGVAVLGTQSRGAFLAVGAMIAFLWLKSERKLIPGLVIASAATLTLMFMPETWWARMATTLDYQNDSSAMGRINAWQFAINLTMDRPIVGGGFNTFTPSLFRVYAPNPTAFHDVHSIYFEALGEHGYVGLMLFLLLALLTWRAGSRLIRLSQAPEEAWARRLGAMAQVSLIGYWTGGAFLGLAYFDGYYLIISLLVLALTVRERELRARSESPEPSLAGAQTIAPGDSPNRAKPESVRSI
jgi:probable O-glycosylation ligase (exosortase A-associated)